MHEELCHDVMLTSTCGAIKANSTAVLLCKYAYVCVLLLLLLLYNSSIPGTRYKATARIINTYFMLLLLLILHTRYVVAVIFTDVSSHVVLAHAARIPTSLSCRPVPTAVQILSTGQTLIVDLPKVSQS